MAYKFNIDEDLQELDMFFPEQPASAMPEQGIPAEAQAYLQQAKGQAKKADTLENMANFINPLANLTKDLTRGTLHFGSDMANFAESVPHLGGSISDKIIPKSEEYKEFRANAHDKAFTPKDVANYLKELSQHEGLRTPETAITEQFQKGGFGDAISAIKQNPQDILPTISKLTAENAAMLAGAASTGGMSLYPELIGNAYDRQVNENKIDPQKAAWISTGEGIVSAKLENIMGAVPVFKQLAGGKISQKVAARQVKTLMQKGLNILGGTAKTAGEEFIEEEAQNFTQNMADNIAGVKTPLTKGIGTSGLAGLFAGLGLGSIGHAATEFAQPQVEQPSSQIHEGEVLPPDFQLPGQEQLRLTGSVASSLPPANSVPSGVIHTSGETVGILPEQRKQLPTQLIEQTQAQLQDDIDTAMQMHGYIQKNVDALGNPLSEVAKQNYMAGLQVLDQNIIENRTALQGYANEINKQMAETMVQNQTIQPDMTPSFAEETPIEKQLMYEELFGQNAQAPTSEVSEAGGMNVSQEQEAVQNKAYNKQADVISGLQQKINEKAKKKAEKRVEELTDKVLEDGLTPQEEAELIQTASAVSEMKEKDVRNNENNRGNVEAQTIGQVEVDNAKDTTRNKPSIEPDEQGNGVEVRQQLQDNREQAQEAGETQGEVQSGESDLEERITNRIKADYIKRTKKYLEKEKNQYK